MFRIDPQKMVMPAPHQALRGRSTPIIPAKPHEVLATALTATPPDTQKALFGMGCFWGAERLFWQQPGVYTTAVGYAGGYTPNPTYEEVCSGLTGHNEVVLIVFWPDQISYTTLLRLFWENHNPTQGMRQANDLGTSYRSGIYWFDEAQRQSAEMSRAHYQQRLTEAKGLSITTELLPAPEFYFAETYHQQYLAKNPKGYCNLQTLAKTGLPSSL
jgi:peptide-methionine (S)-S-oxide reductase